MRKFNGLPSSFTFGRFLAESGVWTEAHPSSPPYAVSFVYNRQAKLFFRPVSVIMVKLMVFELLTPRGLYLFSNHHSPEFQSAVAPCLRRLLSHTVFLGLSVFWPAHSSVYVVVVG